MSIQLTHILSRKPIMEGRYIVFVEGLSGWLEPVVVLWTGFKWTFQNSTEEYTDPIFYWAGPLPVCTVEGWRANCLVEAPTAATNVHAAPPAPVQEYDL